MINYDYLYNKDYYKIDDSYYSDKLLSYRKYSNAFVIPGTKLKNDGIYCGLVDNQYNCIQDSELHNKFSNCSTLDVDYEKCQFVDERVIFVGAWLNVWGHWLTDNIRRFWFLNNDVFKKQFDNCKLVFTCYFKDFKFSKNVKQLFNCLGIDYHQMIEIKELTQFSEIIVPDECFFALDGSKRLYTKEYLSLIEKIKNSKLSNGIEATKSEKIYFSYRKYSLTKSIGEYNLEKFFKKQGYEIIYPEKLDFLSQLAILKKCKHFASTIGSCSHNLVFINKEVEVILIPRANYLTGYQIAINDIIKKDNNIYYIDSSLSIFANTKNPWLGPFFYFISEELIKFFSDKKKAKINKVDFYLYEILSKTQDIYENKEIAKNYFYLELVNNNIKISSKIKPNKILRKFIKLFVGIVNLLSFI